MNWPRTGSPDSCIMMVHWYWKQIFQYRMLHISISLKFTSKNLSSKYQSGNNTQFFFCGVKNRTWSHQNIQLHELRLKIIDFPGQNLFHHNKHILWRDFDTPQGFHGTFTSLGLDPSGGLASAKHGGTAMDCYDSQKRFRRGWLYYHFTCRFSWIVLILFHFDIILVVRY